MMTYDKAPGNLDLAHSRWKRRRHARVRDAGPRLEQVQRYFTNAFRSSGDEDEAREKTMRMFDLDDLKVDRNGRVLSFRVADEELDEIDPGDIEDDVPSVETLGKLNEANRRLWEPDKSGSAGKVADATHTTVRPTTRERRLISPRSQTAGGPPGLAAFNRIARRTWAK